MECLEAVVLWIHLRFNVKYLKFWRKNTHGVCAKYLAHWITFLTNYLWVFLSCFSSVENLILETGLMRCVFWWIFNSIQETIIGSWWKREILKLLTKNDGKSNSRFYCTIWNCSKSLNSDNNKCQYAKHNHFITKIVLRQIGLKKVGHRSAKRLHNLCGDLFCYRISRWMTLQMKINDETLPWPLP